MKVFEKHPAPWRVEYNCANSENGSNIDFIKDAKGEVVASSYNIGFDELWDFYLVLTPEQEKELGRV